MKQQINGKIVAERICDRMTWIQDSAKDTVAGALQLKLLGWQEKTGEYIFRSATADWMRNVIGSLHGGSCAIMVDQAMGCVANCLYEEESHAPTSQLQLNFHRPMMAGEFFLIKVRLVSVSRSMVHLSAEVYAENAPEKLCASASSIFFRENKKD